MIPVYQTRTYEPGGPAGNCYAACIASLLEVPLDRVPQPMMEDSGRWGDPGGYLERLAGWLAAGGWALARWRDRPSYVTTLALEPEPALLGIGSGPSPRHAGIWHSCVVDVVTGDLVHDPHPEGGGVTLLEEVEVLVPLRLRGRPDGKPDAGD